MSLSVPINILLVEDNPLDVRLTKLALQEGGFTKEPVVVDDGIPAMDLLQQKNEFAGCHLPDLVILDLNLKRVDGPEVLAFIKRQPHLAHLCVAVLSSSPEDVMRSRASGANYYFSKPSDLESYVRLGSEIAASYSRSRLAL